MRVAMFPEEHLYYLLGALNSKVLDNLMSALSPTLNFNAGDLKRIPISINNEKRITELVKILVDIESIDWNSRENNWNFDKTQLIKHMSSELSESYDLYKQFWSKKFTEVVHLEEELNQIFIENYGFNEELTPEVTNSEITILKDEISVKSGGLAFNKKEVVIQFISYSVGCSVWKILFR